ncbi:MULTISPECIES: hypothetical protein [unclassified Streptomyces]|uniref:hypothetical protein n=1 Tax=unclassified Streptomyces TaxID=2593676 RepID=UPI0037F73048
MHPPRETGGRHVTVHGPDIGLAHSDLMEFLRQAGIDEPDAEAMVDSNSPEFAWHGAPAHHFEAA